MAVAPGRCECKELGRSRKLSASIMVAIEAGTPQGSPISPLVSEAPKHGSWSVQFSERVVQVDSRA
jgi:hypothetical protein